jgi:hypothetical protein
MALIAIHRRCYSATPPAPPSPYKIPRGPPEHFTPHRAPPISSPAPECPPPSFPNHHHAAATPGCHTTARAPVCRPLNSPRPSPPLSPLGRHLWTPERPEAEAPVSPVPPSTAGPLWIGVSVVHGPVDPVYGDFFMKLIR